MRLNQQQQHLDELTGHLHQAMQRKLTQADQRVERINYKLSLYSPSQTIKQLSHHLAQSERRLTDAMDRSQLTARHQLAMMAEKLEAVSPLATIARGYSITQKEDGSVIRNSEQVSTGDRLVTKVAQGEIRSIVE